MAAILAFCRKGSHMIHSICIIALRNTFPHGYGSGDAF